MKPFEPAAGPFSATPIIPLPPLARRSPSLRRLAPVLVYLAAMLIVFRVPIASGFELGFGERGDAMIEIAILEHWRNVLHGLAAWLAMVIAWALTLQFRLASP